MLLLAAAVAAATFCWPVASANEPCHPPQTAVTALVPASVRVRREQAVARPLSKPPPSSSGFGLVPRTLNQPRAVPVVAAPSVDDKVNAFLAELEGL